MRFLCSALFFVLVLAPSLAGCGQSGQSIEQIEADTAGAEAAWIRGNAALESEDFQNAAYEYTQALELRSDYVDALISRGNAYLALQEYDSARADFDAAISFDPESIDAHLSRATLNWLLGNLAGAEADYATLTRLRPSDSFYAGHYAAALYQQDRPADAEAFYRAAYQADTNRDWALLGWLVATDEAHGPDAALAQATTLYDSGIRTMPVRFAIGEAHFKRQDFYNTITWLGTLQQDDVTQTPPEGISHLAAAFALTGQQSACYAVWQDYLARMGRAHQYDPSQCSVGATP